MFVNEDYNSYKYLVSVNDNYITLTNRHIVTADWQNPATYNVIYQYISPSTLVLEDTKTTSQSLSFSEVDISNNFWDRGDSISIFSVSILIVFIACYILNVLTRIVKRGGIFG